MYPVHNIIKINNNFFLGRSDHRNMLLLDNRLAELALALYIHEPALLWSGSNLTVTGIFPPGKFPLEGSTSFVSPHEKYAWKQRCLALREVCRWREPVPTRILNPNATEASYKLEQRRGEHSLGEYTGVERSGGNFPGGSIPRTLLFTNTASELWRPRGLCHIWYDGIEPLGDVRVMFITAMLE